MVENSKDAKVVLPSTSILSPSSPPRGNYDGLLSVHPSRDISDILNRHASSAYTQMAAYSTQTLALGSFH